MRLAKIKKTYLVAAAALAVGAMICLPRFASAKVTGACYTCHTMHNSQNGKPMTFSAGFGTTNGSATPNDNLVRGNCLQCHTGTNDGTNTIPFVYSGSTESTYGLTGDTLAGGNFWWTVNGPGTKTSDADAVQGGGHDVNYLNTSLAYAFTTPPGYTGTAWNPSTTPLTCAGLYGCHGNRSSTAGNFAAISGAHHADDTTIDGTTVGKSFRFLKGVLGTELNTLANGWEYKPTKSIHNEYKGADRSADTVDDTSTISSLCAQCHGAFHNSNGTYAGGSGIQGSGTAMTTPWVRHPTDYDMDNKGSGTEYAAYTTYDPMVPIGHSTLTNTTNSETAWENPKLNGAIVMCISCHRAHGSPYADLLRWNYQTGMSAGTTDAAYVGTGCFKCHSTKDGA